MVQSKEGFARAKRLQDRPVCITLHNGKTYVGYITGIHSTGFTLASAGELPRTSPGKQGPRPKRHRVGSRGSGSHSSGRRRNSYKPSNRPRSRKADARISAFLPMMGSLFGAFGGGGLGGTTDGGGLGGLFGMIQRFAPVVKLGFGMVKSIRPFLGSIQDLMKPSVAAETANESL